MIRHRHHVPRMGCIDHRIPKRPTSRRPHGTREITFPIHRRRSHKGRVNRQAPRRNRRRAPAVALQLHRMGQNAFAHRIGQRAGHVRGGDPRHHTIAQEGDQRTVTREKRRGRDMQIAQAQRGTFRQNLPHHIVAIAQVVMEGQRRAVLHLGLFERRAHCTARPITHAQAVRSFPRCRGSVRQPQRYTPRSDPLA